MGGSTTDLHRRKRRWPIAFLTIVFALMAGGRVYFRHLYPYGSSHSCTIILGNALRAYAEDHDGFFPSGEATPEASLGLLYSNYADPYQLSGKTVPVKITKQTLIAGKPLDSSSCSWHYVEGLHEDDDLRIALVWDKVAGLGHNGWRLKGSGREVVLVGGNRDYIHGDQWDHFLSEQQELLANRPETLKHKTPSLVITLQMPDGQLVTNYNGAIGADAEYERSDGPGLSWGGRGKLRWYGFPQDARSVKLTLNFPEAGLRSKPIILKLTNGVPETNSVLLPLEHY